MSPYPIVVIVITKYHNISTHSSSYLSVYLDKGRSVTIRKEVKTKRLTINEDIVKIKELFDKIIFIGNELFNYFLDKSVLIHCILEELYFVTPKI